MPCQAYSLLKRVRSNPSAAVTDEFGIPNACNQCHVDKTLEWTHKSLALWNGPATDGPPTHHRNVSLTVVHVLSGHALQRALALGQLGDAGNFEVAGSGWRSRILTELPEDDYDANRLLASEALRKLGGFESFDFD